MADVEALKAAHSAARARLADARRPGVISYEYLKQVEAEAVEAAAALREALPPGPVLIIGCCPCCGGEEGEEE